MAIHRYIYAKLMNKMTEQNIRPGSAAARKFFEREISQTRPPRPLEIFKKFEADDENIMAKPFKEGDIFLFEYKPKNMNNRKKLPYYDQYPVALIVDVQMDHFKAINFHYLHYADRAIFLDKLKVFANNSDFSQTETSLEEISYNNIKVLGGLRYYRASLKRYLNNNVVGRMIKIHPSEWDLALLLPIERFQFARRNRVFSDSAGKY